MSDSTEQLKHLIRLMKSGNQLYLQAQERIEDQNLRSIFTANLRDRQQIIEQLQTLPGAELVDDSEFEEDARFLVDRADLLAVLKDNQAAVYTNQLADLEIATDRLFAGLSRAGLDNERFRHLKFDFDRIRDRSTAARNIAWNRESPTTLPTRMMR